MRFSTALHKAKLLKRYKRFLADVEFEDGILSTAHCPNTGSMESCFQPNDIVWLSKSLDPQRKLPWTWEFTETPHGLIGVNTARPNQVMAEVFAQKLLPAFSNYTSVRREVKYGKNSRIDLLLEGEQQQKCFVEIKNTTLVRSDILRFPDAKTERGQKHLEELMQVVTEGHRAVMLYFINRPDGLVFKPADEIDPVYGRLLRQAVAHGVEILALRCSVTMSGAYADMAVGSAVAVDLS